MKKIYLYNKSLESMEAPRVETIMDALERKSRSGKIAYGPREFSKSQAAAIKQAWPTEVTAWLKSRVRQIVGDKQPSYADFTRAVSDACDEEARKLVLAASAPAQVAKRSLKLASADLSVSLALGTIPQPGLQDATKSIGGKTVCWQSSEKTVNLVASEQRIGQAEIHVLVYYNEQLGRSWLIGWASRDDLRAGAIRDASFQVATRQVPFASLRPISELLGMLGISSSVDGVVIESLPRPDETPSSSDLQIIESDAADKFEEIIFGQKQGPAAQGSGADRHAPTS
jgi:hypothetical protein